MVTVASAEWAKTLSLEEASLLRAAQRPAGSGHGEGAVLPAGELMLALALTALVAAAPLTPDVHGGAGRAARGARVRARGPPRADQDKALTEAARRLARESLGRQVHGDRAGPALAHHGRERRGRRGPESPRSFVIRAWAHAHAIETFLARKDFNGEPATHFGVGVVTAGERATLMLLLAERKAELQSTSRATSREPPGHPGAVRRAGARRCAAADVYVTLPGRHRGARAPHRAQTGAPLLRAAALPQGRRLHRGGDWPLRQGARGGGAVPGGRGRPQPARRRGASLRAHHRARRPGRPSSPASTTCAGALQADGR